jgi:UPF0716 family protein affecting phage T7 exclusion
VSKIIDAFCDIIVVVGGIVLFIPYLICDKIGEWIAVYKISQWQKNKLK